MKSKLEFRLLTSIGESQLSPRWIESAVPEHPARLNFVEALPEFAPETDAGVIVDPIASRRQLILIADSHHSLRINGTLVPHIAIAAAGDHVEVQNEHNRLCFFVTLHHRPHIATPDQRHLGKECATCGIPFDPSTRVYICACGNAIHAEDPAGSAEPLSCASLATQCPNCSAPIVLVEGHAWKPEDFHA